MADVTATAHVFPSANDLEGAQPNGWGETLYEKNLATFWLAGLQVNNYTISGAVLPASDADLTVPIPTGKFWLDGRFVEIAATNITFPASSTSFLFAKLLKDVNGNVSSVAFEHNTSGTPPADATPIGSLVSSGSAITSTTDRRIVATGYVEVLTSGTSWSFPAGITRVYAEVLGASGGGGGGGEGYASASGAPGNDGSAGGGGGSTTFGPLTANGGGGGARGNGGGSASAVPASASPGSSSGGTVVLTGMGAPGGLSGLGGSGSAISVPSGQTGGPGDNGGYAASYIMGAVGSTVTYTIGSAGSAGAGGDGPYEGTPGGNGLVGQAGRIVIHY